MTEVSHLREAMIKRWYHANENILCKTWEEIPGLEDVREGMYFRGNEVREADSTLLGHFLRSRQPDRPPLVRLVLPNPLSFTRYKAVEQVVEELGGQTVTVPPEVLGSADIQASTIEVIHSHKRLHPFRARQQLFRANTRSSWGTKPREGVYFLNGYDLNEPGLSYFMCELPPSARPTTVMQAYASLKPQSVVLAERAGARVKRQGDMFFIPMPRFTPRTEPAKDFLHHTNHLAEHVVRQDGLTYVRGKVRHAPLGRVRDHQNLHLGTKWYLCVKNTVPVTR